MKIVKFKNGMYGVRRWSWISGYQFAINKSGDWCYKTANYVQEFNNLEFANEVLENARNITRRNKDMGI